MPKITCSGQRPAYYRPGERLTNLRFISFQISVFHFTTSVVYRPEHRFFTFCRRFRPKYHVPANAQHNVDPRHVLRPEDHFVPHLRFSTSRRPSGNVPEHRFFTFRRRFRPKYHVPANAQHNVDPGHVLHPEVHFVPDLRFSTSRRPSGNVPEQSLVTFRRRFRPKYHVPGNAQHNVDPGDVLHPEVHFVHDLRFFTSRRPSGNLPEHRFFTFRRRFSPKYHVPGNAHHKVDPGHVLPT